MDLEVCRICRQKPKIFHVIFEERVEDIKTISDIQAILLEVMSVEVTNDAAKSKIICRLCYGKLRSFYEFYNQIVTSEKEWERHAQEVASSSVGEFITADDGAVLYCEIKVSSEVKEEVQEIEIPMEEDSFVEFVEEVEERTKTRQRVKKRSAHKPANLDKKEYEEQDEELRRFYGFSCFQCPREISLETFADFKAHMREEHDEKTPYMMCCDVKLTKRYALVQHMKFHTKSDELRCPVCDKLYTKRDILMFHMKQMHGSDEERPYVCAICQKRFVRLESLRTHMKMHLSKEEKEKLKIHKCVECGIMCQTIHSLNNHIKYKHLKLMAYFCAGCARHYKSRLDYEIHRRNVHGDSGPERAQCHLCSKWFSHEKSLKTHIRDTHNEQPGPHVCIQCGHRTKSRQALRSHVKMKHGERKFACTFCDKAFQTARQLSEHTTVHVGGALYSCSFCDRTFNSNSNMYKHLKVVHPEDWERDKKIRQLTPGAVQPKRHQNLDC